MGCGYAQALALIVRGGATHQDIQEGLNLSRASAQKLCRGFHGRLTHIAEYVPLAGYPRMLTPRYALGKKPDAPWPRVGKPIKPCSKPLPLELLTFIHAVEALMADSHHGCSLADEVGYARGTAMKLLYELHDLKLTYVETFSTSVYGSETAPMYAWGPGKKDRRKKAPKPLAELWPVYYQRRANRLAQAKLMQAMVNAAPLRKPRESANRPTCREAIAA